MVSSPFTVGSDNESSRDPPPAAGPPLPADKDLHPTPYSTSAHTAAEPPVHSDTDEEFAGVVATVSPSNGRRQSGAVLDRKAGTPGVHQGLSEGSSSGQQAKVTQVPANLRGFVHVDGEDEEGEPVDIDGKSLSFGIWG